MVKVDKVHTKDKVLKESLSVFQDNSLDFLGVDLNTTIDMPLGSEITEVVTKKAFADLIFKLKDGNGLNVEWEDQVNLDDILRFFSYSVDFTRKYKISFTTIIITNKSPKATEYISPTMSFNPIIIVLSERDADETLQKIREKIKNGEPINKLELIYLPMYTSPSGKNMYTLLSEAIQLTPVIAENKEEKEKLHSLMILLMGKFADEDRFKKVLEENRMILEDNVAVKVIEEMGMEKGKEEMALSMLKDGLSLEFIAKHAKRSIEWIEALQKNNTNI